MSDRPSPSTTSLTSWGYFNTLATHFVVGQHPIAWKMKKSLAAASAPASGRRYNRMNIKAIGLTLALGTAAVASEFEELPILAADQVAPPELLSGPDWRVDARVPVEGYLEIFTIRSTYGVVPVHGRIMLDVRAAEQAAIARLAELSQGEAFAQALENSAGAALDTFKTAITNPVETVKNIPAGVGRFFTGIGKAVGRTAQGISDSVDGNDDRSTSEQAAEAGASMKNAMGFNKARRQISRQLGIDPYTSNPVLAGQLDRVSRAMFLGGLTVNLTIGIVAMPVRIGQAVVNMAWDMPPADLNEQNMKKMLAWGVPDEAARAFQRNRAFTLTQQTGLVELLDALSAVKGRPKIIDHAVAADSEDEALFLIEAMRILRRYDQDVAAIHAVDVPATLPVGVLADGSRICPLAVDLLPWTQGVADFVRKVDPKVKVRGIYLSGHATPLAKARLSEHGWQVHEDFLR